MKDYVCTCKASMFGFLLNTGPHLRRISCSFPSWKSQSGSNDVGIKKRQALQAGQIHTVQEITIISNCPGLTMVQEPIKTANWKALQKFRDQGVDDSREDGQQRNHWNMRRTRCCIINCWALNKQSYSCFLLSYFLPKMFRGLQLHFVLHLVFLPWTQLKNERLHVFSNAISVSGVPGVVLEDQEMHPGVISVWIWLSPPPSSSSKWWLKGVVISWLLLNPVWATAAMEFSSFEDASSVSCWLLTEGW